MTYACCVSVPQPEEHRGAAAERVSNACFAALMLMNSFSQMVSASEGISSLAGLTSRLHRLFEVLPRPFTS